MGQSLNSAHNRSLIEFEVKNGKTIGKKQVISISLSIYRNLKSWLKGFFQHTSNIIRLCNDFCTTCWAVPTKRLRQKCCCVRPSNICNESQNAWLKRNTVWSSLSGTKKINPWPIVLSKNKNCKKKWRSLDYWNWTLIKIQRDLTA